MLKGFCGECGKPIHWSDLIKRWVHDEFGETHAARPKANDDKPQRRPVSRWLEYTLRVNAAKEMT